MKKFLWILSCAVLAVCLLFILPAEAHAAEIVASGDCGYPYNISWALDNEGTLTISGTGDMKGWVTETDIPWYVSRDSIKNIVIEPGVTSVGYRAFFRCSNLVSVSIPQSVTSIEAVAFAYCYSLTSVEIPDEVSYIGSSAFEECTALTEVKMSNSVTNISDYTFEGCTSLVSITIPNGVTDIGTSAFKDCSKLSSINIPQSVKRIGSDAFYGCAKLVDVHITDIDTWFNLSFGNLRSNPLVANTMSKSLYLGAELIDQLVVSNHIPTIRVNAFYNCSHITEVIISDGVTDIGASAFEGLTELTEIAIPDSVTSIGANALKGCTKLEKLTLPFLGADNTGGSFSHIFGDSIPVGIKYVSIASGAISSGSFFNCQNLIYVDLPDNLTSIEVETFYGCHMLKGISIPSGVTNIGERAFYNCKSLVGVSFPESVTSIGSFAFAYCDALNHISYEGTSSQWSDITLGTRSFYTDSNRVKAARHYEAGVEQIGIKSTCVNNFVLCDYCENILYEEIVEGSGHIIENGICTECGMYDTCGDDLVWSLDNSGTLTISGTGSMTDWGLFGSPWYSNTAISKVVIKEGVTSIGDDAFDHCTSLTSVAIPSSVTSIGKDAFYYCTSLTSITIPDSVISIGAEAFSGCTGLTSISIPDSVTTIGDWAFYGCTGLTGIKIPSNITKIGYFAFEGCTSLNSVIYCGTQEQWNAVSISEGNSTLTGATVQLHDYKNDICTICEDFAWKYTVTDSEVTITGYTGTKTDLTIPSTIESLPVTTIGYRAFYNYTNLANVTIPGSVTEIDNQAFCGCSGLISLTIHENTSVNNSAFQNCVIKKLIIADGSRNVTPTMIICKDTLEEIVIPNSVIYITEQGLQNSKKLTTVTFENNSQLSTIGYGTFNGCSNLISINWGENSRLTTIDGYAFNKCINLKNFAIPDSVTGIGSHAFYGCENLTSIRIPNGVTTIEDYTFWGCTSLTSVSIGNRVVTIEGFAFRECSSLLSITIPDSVTSIGEYAFISCSGLTSLNFGENSQLTNIGDRAFAGCSSLTSVTIPDSVTSLGYYAFRGCSNLISAAVGNGVLKLSGTFENCTSLTNITIGNNVHNIDTKAFNNCSSLTAIVIPEDANLGEAVFSGCSSLESITFSYESKKTFGYYFGTESYAGGKQTAQFYYDETWEQETAKAYYIPATLKSVTVIGGEIPGYAFENCTTLVNVSISCPATQLGAYAFYNCTGLTNVAIENGLTAINGYAFYNCTSLKSITIPNTVTSIWIEAFYNCTSLTDITIPHGVTTLGQEAFYNCTGLTSIAIPDSVTAIGRGVFRGCRNLISVTIPFVGDGEWSTSDIYPLGWIFGGNANDIGMLQTKQNYYHYDSITNGTFYLPATLKSVTVTGGDVPAYAFHNCTELTSITIPANATSIGIYAFYNCTGLTNIAIPEKITRIGQYAFGQCSNLTDIVFTGNSRLTNIDYSAFVSCTGLIHITIPSGVTTIGDRAFNGCSNLAVVFFQGTEAAHQSMRIGSNNTLLASAVWHYQATDAEFAGQNCYYCAKCGNYFLPDGNYAMATVVFKDWDGTVLETKQYKYGDTVKPTNSPTREHENALVYKWVFTSWDNELTACTGNAEYTAIYTETYMDYTILFKNWNGEVLSTGTYHWGNAIEWPTIPTKPADNTYTYTFAGWDNNVAFCEGDATYTATYTPTYIDYTVEFKDWNGTLLSTKTYHWGDSITVPANPIRTGKIYTYTFTGWDNEVVDCAGDAIYTATYTYTYIDYTIVFKDWDGTVLSSNTYHYGDAVIKPANPKRAADNTYTYTFDGWDSYVIATCNGNETYTATYKSNYINYRVIFKNWNGKVISDRTYHWGDTITVPGNPTKAADYTATYTFAGWDNDVVATCAGNATYTATFTPVYIDYTVVFKNWDGTVLSTNTYHFGDEITEPANPTKEVDKNFSIFTFIGWDNEVSPCMGNATYTAVYKEEYICYTVVFKDWDGTVLSSIAYHWGEPITVPINPTKAADNTYTYTFAGWDKTVVNCAGDATYTATYTATYIEYTVEFKDWNGTILSTKTYHWGDVVTAPSNPIRPDDIDYTYTFTGWDNPIVACNGNAIYRAVYSSKSRVPSTITSSAHTISGGTISNISTGTTVSALVGKLNEKEYVKVYNGNQEVSGNTPIGTGMVVKIMDGNTAKANYTIIVTGDTNGDGKITVTDMLAVKAHVLQKSTMTGTTAQAADTSGDNAISVTDFIQLKAHILGKSNVEPRNTPAAPAQLLSSASTEPATQSAPNTPAATVMTANYTVIYAQLPSKKTVLV